MKKMEKLNLKFHHIGLMTDSTEATARELERLGYEISPATIDPLQSVKISLATITPPHLQSPVIEIVEPMESNPNMLKRLKKTGVSPYHFCYETDDIEKCFKAMTEEYEYIPLFRPVPALAFDSKQICYFYKPEIGFIEIIEQ